MRTTLDRASAVAERFFLIVACLAIALMAVHIVVDVALRYLLNQPLIGTIEIVSTYYMVSVVFLPLAAVQRQSGHIIVELFTQSLSPKALRRLDMLVRIACVAMLAVYIQVSIESAVEQTARGEAWEATMYLIPVWPSRWCVPAGLIAMAVCMVVQILADLFGTPADEAPAAPAH